MPNISIETGLKTFDLNDAVTVTFNPTDILYAERIIHTMEMLEAMQREYNDRYNADSDYAIVVKAAHELNDKMREMIDELFDVPVCQPLFGDVAVYSPADGLPLWCNLLLAVIDEMDDSIGREKAKTNPRIEKYIKKYDKKRGG